MHRKNVQMQHLQQQQIVKNMLYVKNSWSSQKLYVSLSSDLTLWE